MPADGGGGRVGSQMGLPGACDVFMRIGTETDVTKLTPHGWKQHFAQDAADHHEDILCRLRDHFAKAK